MVATVLDPFLVTTALMTVAEHSTGLMIIRCITYRRKSCVAPQPWVTLEKENEMFYLVKKQLDLVYKAIPSLYIFAI